MNACTEEDDTTIYGGNGTPDINVMEGYVEDDLSDSISSGLDIFDEPPDNSIVKVNATRKKFKLASHIKQIKEHPPIFLCTACKGHFSHKRTVNNHEYCVGGRKPYKCELCEKRFLKKYDCNNHARTHTGEKPFECSICQKSFSLKHKLNRHMRSHVVDKGEFKCQLCQKSFSKAEALKKHQVTKHTGIDKIQCKNCRKNFNKVEERSKHHCIRKPRGKKLVCEMCGKTFSSKWNLVVHQKIHTSQRPFVCGECHKSFRLRQHRDRHATKHQPEADFECTLCKQAFGRKDNMIRHLKLNHPDRHLGVDIGEMVKTSRRSIMKATGAVAPKQVASEAYEQNIVALEHLPNIRYVGQPKVAMDSPNKSIPEQGARAIRVLRCSPQINPMPDDSLLYEPSRKPPSTSPSSVIKLASSLQASEPWRNEITSPIANSSLSISLKSDSDGLSSDPTSNDRLQQQTSTFESCRLSDSIRGKSVIRAVFQH